MTTWCEGEAAEEVEHQRYDGLLSDVLTLYLCIAFMFCSVLGF